MPAESTAQNASQLMSILIVDTDPGVRWSLEKGLANSGFLVKSASTAEQAIALSQEEQASGILFELMPDAGLTMELLSTMIQAPGRPKVVCTSVDSNPKAIIECMRRGAADFLARPFSLAEVRTTISRVLASKTKANAQSEDQSGEDKHDKSLLVGVSLPIQEVLAVLKQVARTNLNCLILGESGVGKDVVAREIHRLSDRKDQPFVKVNCSALPEQLLESELFGYEKGAFTGAIVAKPGRFTLADGGIIFLDEISEITLPIQAKLLQVIEHKEFTKLGGRRPSNVDVQIITATNRDIEQSVKNGDFRHDLYFRLNEISIRVPTLSERREDVPLLVRHFLQKHKHLVGEEDFELRGDELAALSERDWPGNVRELESTIKRMLVLGGLDQGLALAPLEPPKPKPASAPTSKEITETLDRFQWNRRKAAEALGMSYQALRRRIEKLENAEQH